MTALKITIVALLLVLVSFFAGVETKKYFDYSGNTLSRILEKPKAEDALLYFVLAHHYHGSGEEGSITSTLRVRDSANEALLSLGEDAVPFLFTFLKKNIQSGIALNSLCEFAQKQSLGQYSDEVLAWTREKILVQDEIRWNTSKLCEMHQALDETATRKIIADLKTTLTSELETISAREKSAGLFANKIRGTKMYALKCFSESEWDSLLQSCIANQQFGLAERVNAANLLFVQSQTPVEHEAAASLLTEIGDLAVKVNLSDEGETVVVLDALMEIVEMSARRFPKVALPILVSVESRFKQMVESADGLSTNVDRRLERSHQNLLGCIALIEQDGSR